MRLVARDHAEVGERIDRIAFVQQSAQRRRRVLRLQQRTVALAADAPQQRLVVGVEPDRDAAFAHPLARARIHEGAAAGGQHERTLVEQTRHDPPLPVAKIGLAEPREDFRNAEAGGGGDFGVGVDEFEAELLRKTMADRAFARAHHADEHEALISKRGPHPQTTLVRKTGWRRFGAGTSHHGGNLIRFASQ